MGTFLTKFYPLPTGFLKLTPPALNGYARLICSKISRGKPYQCQNKNSDHDACINDFIVFGQPFGQVNIEIVFPGIRILSCPNGQWTIHFEYQQGQTLKKNQPVANPQPLIHFICQNSIQHIKDNHIEKYPNDGVQDFYQCKFGLVCHKLPKKGLNQ
jgi:hypothetical protein